MAKGWSLRSVAHRLFGSAPYDVIGQFSLSASVERQKLLEEVLAVLEFEGLPDDWDEEYFKLHLIQDGVICITDTSLGVIPLKTGVSGINVWDRPTECVIGNAVLGSFRRTIGVDCALIHLTYNYKGIHELLDMYAYLLANCDGSISVNLMNTRVTFIGECETKAQAETMKKMYDEITHGKPAVFIRQSGTSPSTYQFLNPKQSYIADDIMLLKQKIKAEFLGMIGIRSVNMEKKERLIQSEVDSGNADVQYNIDHWITTINKGLEVANRLYGLNIKCRKKEFNSEGGSPDANAIQYAGGKSQDI